MGNNNYGASASPVPRSDVEVALGELGDKFVSEPIALADGRQMVLHAGGLVPVMVPALNPLLPDRVKQDETMVEPKSFSAYVTAFKSPSAICRASLSKNSIVAVLDYHGRAREGSDFAVPNHGHHVVTLLCPFDLDYARWRPIFAGKQTLDQEQLGRFLEDMIHTIAAPPAGDLTDAIADLEIVRHVHFKSARNDRNGNISIGYQELDDDNVPGREGKLELPDHVEVVVPIFQGGNPVQLTAKLRHRMDKGVVAFSLIVPSIDVKEREAFRAIGEAVAKDTETPVFYVA